MLALDWTEAQAFSDLMSVRRSQISFRLGMAGATVALFFLLFRDFAIVIWGAVYAALQGWEAMVFRRERIGSLCEAKSYRALALGILAANTAIFASIPFVELPKLGLWCVTYGEAVVAATFLNLALTSHSCKRAFFTAFAPGLIYLLILPIVAWRIFGCPGTSAIAIGVVGFALVVGTLKLWSYTGAAQEAERRARQALIYALTQAEAANEAKSAFLAIMSHEIRTPLNGVLGMVQAMAADEMTPVQRKRLEVVGQSGQTLLCILNDVLDISKIEAGRLELESIEFSLSAVAAGCHAAFTTVAQGKGLSFLFAIDDDALGVYLGDPTRLRQILYNLLSNAMKFTAAGEVAVRMSRFEDRLVISVKDTGVGMTPEQMERLFQKFAQADASTTRKFGGTGLGLAIVRDLAVAMGGDIQARSALGEGTTFDVQLGLPWIGPDVDSDHVVSLHNPEGYRPSFKPLGVLVAEDNEINQLVIETLLSQVGVFPVMVGNGRLAMEAWETQSWDVILMDVQMPEMDGPTASRLIRKRETETGRPRTPILALTANAMTHQITEYLAAGMDGHIAKPIEASCLFSALEQVLEDHPETMKAKAEGPAGSQEDRLRKSEAYLN